MCIFLHFSKEIKSYLATTVNFPTVVWHHLSDSWDPSLLENLLNFNDALLMRQLDCIDYKCWYKAFLSLFLTVRFDFHLLTVWDFCPQTPSNLGRLMELFEFHLKVNLAAPAGVLYACVFLSWVWIHWWKWLLAGRPVTSALCSLWFESPHINFTAG